MKLLLISLCKFELSELEFVDPIKKVLVDFKISFDKISFKDLSKISLSFLNEFDKIILCGTALMDFDYLEYFNSFKSFDILKDFRGDLLGICSGSQILTLLFGGDLINFKEIGLNKLNVVKDNVLVKKCEDQDDVILKEIYCLHLKSCDVDKNPNFIVLARTQVPQIFKIKDRNFYAVLFHPEYRNVDILKNFLKF